MEKENQVPLRFSLGPRWSRNGLIVRCWNQGLWFEPALSGPIRLDDPDARMLLAWLKEQFPEDG